MKANYMFFCSLLVLSFLISACEEQNVDTNKENNEEIETGVVYMGIDAAVSLVNDNNGKRFIFKVKNQNETVETLIFPTSAQYDYIVRNKENEIKKQLSKEAYYLQVITTVQISQGEELVYEVPYERVVSGLGKGTYTIEFMSAANSKDIRAKLRFEVK